MQTHNPIWEDGGLAAACRVQQDEVVGISDRRALAPTV